MHPKVNILLNRQREITNIGFLMHNRACESRSYTPLIPVAFNTRLSICGW